MVRLVHRPKRGRAFRFGERLNALALVMFGLIVLYPFWYILIISLTNGWDTLRGGVYLLPRKFSLENYQRVFENSNIVNAYGITLLRSSVCALAGTTLCAMLAYALLDKGMPGRVPLLFFFFFTTIFSGGMIPYYILLRQLKLTNTLWVYIVPHLYSFYNTMLLRTYFGTIPSSLSESARIDGCSEARIFFQIYIPLSIPAIMTVILFFAVQHWNDWFTGIYYVSNKKLLPVASLLHNFLSESTFENATFNQSQFNTNIGMSSGTTTPESLRMAFIVVMTLPIVFGYPFVQKYFMKGLMIGAVKG